MSLLLRRQNAQDVVEGQQPKGWKHDDFAVLEDETVVGRIYKTAIHGEPRWLWFLDLPPVAPPPNNGMCDSLDEAKAEFKKRYDALCPRR